MLSLSLASVSDASTDICHSGHILVVSQNTPLHSLLISDEFCFCTSIHAHRESHSAAALTDFVRKAICEKWYAQVLLWTPLSSPPVMCDKFLFIKYWTPQWSHSGVLCRQKPGTSKLLVLFVFKRKINIPSINPHNATSHKNKQYIQAAEFFMAPRGLKLETAYISKCSSSMRAHSPASVLSLMQIIHVYFPSLLCEQTPNVPPNRPVSPQCSASGAGGADGVTLVVVKK